jgi:putative FmdB family regulatory protein
VPIYVYRCECGLDFERLLPVDAAAPGCPACGGATRKIPAGFSLGGQARTGLAKERMPQTWRGLYDGDREYVTRMQRTWERRQKLEAKHPELAGDQRPIIAHEGRFHDTPLRAGDQPAAGVDPAPGTGAGHGHGHGHGHGGAHGHGHGGHGDGGHGPGPGPGATAAAEPPPAAPPPPPPPKPPVP